MKLLDGETILWTSKNKKLTLTSARLRENDKSITGSVIRSIMLSELTYSELDTKIDWNYFKKGVFIFIIANLAVYFMNKFLFDSELFKFLFEDFHIGQQTVAMVFYLTLVIFLASLMMSAFSFRRTLSFYAGEQKIKFQLRNIGFDEREAFISMVEQAKEKSMRA